MTSPTAPIPAPVTRTGLAGRRGRQPELALALPTWTRLLLLPVTAALMVIQFAVDGSFGYRDAVLVDPTDLRVAAHVATVLGLLAVFAAWPIRVRLVPTSPADQTSTGLVLPRLARGEEEASRWPLDQTSTTDQTSDQSSDATGGQTRDQATPADRWPDQTSNPDQATIQTSHLDRTSDQTSQDA